MLIDLNGRVVVISGAGRGIGRALATRFVEEGATVVALDLHFAEALEPGIHQHECDVSDEVSVRTVVTEIVAQHGRVDVLINNAGINVEGAIEDLTLAQWRRCFDVNVAGVFLLTQAIIPVMKQAGWGRILNAASFAAIVPSINSAAYAASKAAVVQFTRVAAGELGPWGITVNAYAPGMVPTAMNGFDEMPEARRESLLDTLSVRRWQKTDDVADLLCFLASDRASYITGTLVDVSGGKLATQMPSVAYEARNA